MMFFKKITVILILLSWIFILSCSNQTLKDSERTEFHFEVKAPVFQEKSFDITRFGAVGDGITMNTEAISKAINECTQSGGGRVIIPAGIWLTGPIHLKSDVNLLIKKGAIVVFSKNFDDYPFISSFYEGRKDYRAMPLIYANGAENIAITGKGIFNGSGEAWRPVKKFKMTEDQWKALINSGGVLNEKADTWWPNQYAYEASLDPEKYRSQEITDEEREKYKAFFRPPMVQLVDCKVILIEGPVFQNSPNWGIHPAICTDMTINDITVINPWYAQNGDGIDLESCIKVRITNSFFDVGDDAICLKSGRDKEGRERAIPCQFVDISKCVVLHGHGGFVVGSEMSGGVYDVWVNNCSFTGTDIGLRFKSTRGRGGVVERINIENIRMINIPADAISFNLFYAGNDPSEDIKTSRSSISSAIPAVTEETPEFRNITMRNILCMGAERAVQILGLPEMPVNAITLENSVFSSIQGINCIFGNNLKFIDLQISTSDSPTMNIWNSSGIDITNLSGNNILYKIGGADTKDIIIRTDDVETANKELIVGEEINAEEISIEGI
jgi:polygalacturonase